MPCNLPLLTSTHIPGDVHVIPSVSCRQDVVMPPQPDVCPELRALIQELLTKDPATRPTAAAALSHPWVNLGGAMPLPSLYLDGGAAAAASAAAAGGWAPSPSTAAAAAAAAPEPIAPAALTAEELREAVHELEHGTSEMMELVFREVQYQDR